MTHYLLPEDPSKKPQLSDTAVPSRRKMGWETTLDVLAFVFMIPFCQMSSLTLSCYITVTKESTSYVWLSIRYAVLGPLAALLTLALLSVYVIGYLMWCTVNMFGKMPLYKISSPRSPHAERELKCPSRFTISSANVLLPPEYIARINNMSNVYQRVFAVCERLLNQDTSLNEVRNLHPPVKRESIVQARLPDVDVLMCQEVFERYISNIMLNKMKKKYPYCIHEVGYYSEAQNFFFLGSGLFVASKFPIMEACFRPFSKRKNVFRYANIGVLVVKLQLGLERKDDQEVQAVGYVANLHTQAFDDHLVAQQLEEAQVFFKAFIDSTFNSFSEDLLFTVLGGDFNSDNMSPANSTVQNMNLWNEYNDPCIKSKGSDHDWCVGTEFRLRTLHQPAVKEPELLQDVLLDDVRRRYFILDADVKVQDYSLMWIDPTPDCNGEVKATSTGGRRRIDRILLRKGSQVCITGYWFSSILAGLSDHIPVTVMLEKV